MLLALLFFPIHPTRQTHFDPEKDGQVEYELDDDTIKASQALPTDSRK